MTKAPHPMGAQTTFGICTFADNAKEYAFFRAVAIRDSDQKLSKITQPKDVFPNNGTIRVLLEKLKLPGARRGNSAFFQVEDDPHFEDHKHKPNAVRFRATAIFPSLKQLVSLNIPSSKPDQISESLNAGIRVGGEPTSKTQIYLHLADGIVIGPIGMKAVDDLEHYRAEEKSLYNPIPAWSNVHSLHVQQFEVEYKDYRYVVAETSPSGFTVDLAPPAFTLKRVLEYLVDNKQTAGVLTKRKSGEIAHLVSKAVPPPELVARFKRAQALLENHAVAEAESDSLIAELLQSERAKSQIEAAKASAKEQAQRQASEANAAVNAQIEAAKKELTALKAEEAKIAAQLKAGEAALKAIEDRAATVEKEFSAKLHENISRARTDATGLLAQIALLRPFLAQEQPSITRAPHPSGSPTPSLVVRQSAAAREFDGVKEFVQHIGQSLIASGLKDPSNRVATTVFTALSLNQSISIRGSFAPELATALADACFGKQWTEVAIPVGLVDQLASEQIFQDTDVTQGAVIFGANRSCISAYLGSELDRYKLIRRPTSKAPNNLIFVLNEGPSALRPSIQYVEAGPVIHTDAFRWSIPPGQFVERAFCRATISDEKMDLEKEQKDIEAMFADTPNAAVQLACLAALKRYATVHKMLASPSISAEQVALDAFTAVLSFWVIPALATSGVERRKVSSMRGVPTKDQSVSKTITAWLGAETSTDE